MQWYVMQVKTGDELAARNMLQAQGIAAKVPQEIALLRKGGMWKSVERVLFTGYVFVGSDNLSAHEYYAAIKVPGYVRFLGRSGAGPEPEAISKKEAEYICVLSPTNEAIAPSVVRMDGDRPVIVSGVLHYMPGQIVKYNLRQQRARVQLSVLGEDKQIDFSIVLEGTPIDTDKGMGDE